MQNTDQCQKYALESSQRGEFFFFFFFFFFFCNLPKQKQADCGFNLIGLLSLMRDTPPKQCMVRPFYHISNFLPNHSTNQAEEFKKVARLLIINNWRLFPRTVTCNICLCQRRARYPR